MTDMITKSDFDEKVLKSDTVTLVDFFATWCGPCQALIPVLDELSGELPSGAQIFKVDVDNDPELASQYGVMSIPALKVFKGGKVVEESMGVKSKEGLLEMIENHL
jgi:thioredoxin 1